MYQGRVDFGGASLTTHPLGGRGMEEPVTVRQSIGARQLQNACDEIVNRLNVYLAMTMRSVYT